MMVIPMAISNRPIRIGIVDDHELVRDGLALRLATAGHEVVHSCGTGAEMLTCLRDEPVDVCLVDLRLPDMSGYELTAELADEFRSIPIIVLSAFISDDGVTRALEAGAISYVAKSSGVAFLLGEIQRVMAAPRGSVNAEVISRQLYDRRAVGAHVLTEQQELLLSFAADGFTDRQIATQMNLAESTVRFHIQRLKGVFDVRSKTELISYAIRHELIRSIPLDVGSQADRTATI